jgi:hypothetical protein
MIKRPLHTRKHKAVAVAYEFNRGPWTPADAASLFNEGVDIFHVAT